MPEIETVNENGQSQKIKSSDPKVLDKHSDRTDPPRPTVVAKQEKTPINMPSEEYKEVMGKSPGWLLSWGLTAFLVLLIIVFSLAYFVRYPDVLETNIVFLARNPPATILARNSGYFSLKVANRQVVEQGQILGVIQNLAKLEDVIVVENWNQQLRQEVKNETYSSFSIVDLEGLKLGNLTESTLGMVHLLEKNNQINNIGKIDKQIDDLRHEIFYHNQFNTLREKESVLLAEEYHLAQAKFKIDSGLWTKEAMSDWDYMGVRHTYIAAKKSQANGLRESLTQQQQTEELRARLESLYDDRREVLYRNKEEVITQIERIEKDIVQWKRNYVLISPIAGKVDFYNYWRDNEYVNNGEEVMTIIPDSTGTIFGQVFLSMKDVGKVEPGMKVLVSFESYPKGEFGFVEGLATTISSIPRENKYLVRVNLENSLVTTSNYQIPYKQEMEGNAKIITREQSLLSRMLSKMTESFNKI